MNEVSVSFLRPHPRNAELFPEKLPDHIWNELVADIKENGVINPLIVTPDYTIIAGHLRLEAAKEAGLTHVPVMIRDIEPNSDEAVSLLIRDNLLRRHLSGIQTAKLIKKLKEEYNIRQGRQKVEDGRIGRIKHEKISQFLNLSERRIQQLDKLNDLIPELQELMSSGKLSSTAAYCFAFLPQEEQKQLLAALGESGICDLSVESAKELRRELEESRKREKELLKRLAEAERKFAKAANEQAEKESLQKELDALRAELAALKDAPVERVVEKVVYRSDPALEAELEAARKQNRELLREKELVEDRLKKIAQEKERKETKLSSLEEELKRLQRYLDQTRQKLEEERSRPKPPQWSKEHLEFQSFIQEATRNAASLATVLKQILDKHTEKLLAAARVRGSSGGDFREMAGVVGDVLLFKAFDASLSTAMSAAVEIWEVLEPGRPRLELVKGKKKEGRGIGTEI